MVIAARVINTVAPRSLVGVCRTERRVLAVVELHDDEVRSRSEHAGAL